MNSETANKSPVALKDSSAESSSEKMSNVSDSDQSGILPHNPEPLIPTPPELADKYTFNQVIGRGAQATVYLATRNSDNAKVAIKHLNIDSVQNWKEYDLFHREAEVLKNLNIDGVAKFYDAPEFLDIEHPSAYIVQEYIDGPSLEEFIKNGYRFTIQKLFRFVLQLLEILNQLHTHEPPIIHRDLKPGNILMKMQVNGEYKPYLIDFGAVANPMVQSGGSTVAGTYGYMPPEQLMGNPVPASDIYSLAAMIAYLLSGVFPGNMQVVDFHLIIEPHLENIPNIITATLHQMLEPTVKNRLTDYHSLRERFELFAAGKFEMSFGTSGNLDQSKLLKVQKLGQRGNIDLWMSLPDQTPRKIPAKYQKLHPIYDVDKKSIYPILKMHYIKMAIRTVLTDSIFCISLTTGVIIVILLHNSLIPIVTISAIFSIIIFTIICSDTIPFSKQIKELPVATKQWNSLDSTSQIDKDNINTLLSSGIKSMASIVDCKYEPSHINNMEVYEQISVEYRQNMQNSEVVSNGYRGYLHTYPRFKLRYKFNPPDDDNPDDLVHEIYIHHDISNLLQPGDPLPILYYVNPENNLDVMSMPFPYPLGDIASLNEMYYRKSD